MIQTPYEYQNVLQSQLPGMGDEESSMMNTFGKHTTASTLFLKIMLSGFDCCGDVNATDTEILSR